MQAAWRLFGNSPGLTDFKIDYQERAMTEKKVPTSSTAKKSGSRPAAAKNASPAIMEKEAESKEVKTALSTTVTTVTTSALKGQFAAGSIPLSTDFGNLIDIAECGRRAIGQSADQTDNSIGVGLALATDDDAANKGKLSVKAGDGITVNANGVSVKAGDGLEFVSSNLEVKSANGINVNANGVSLSLGGGLEFIGSDVHVKSAKGITVDDSGVNVHIGNGLTFDNYALTIDQKTLLPTEMIMMYCPPSGTTTPPDGWIFCDGSDCRAPNLVDRFILGGSASSVGGKNSTTLSKDSNSKSFSATSDNGNLVLAASIDSTALTVAQMPKHSHDIIMSGSPQWALYEGPHHTMPTGDNTDTINPAYITDSGTRLINTDAGEDNGHSHGVHISSLGHSHGLIIAVPYYILTFIMKT
jgi:microcystin-dependent protein